MRNAREIATGVWRLGWGLLFVVIMTILSECSSPSLSAPAPHLFSAKTVPSPSAQNETANWIR